MKTKILSRYSLYILLTVLFATSCLPVCAAEKTEIQIHLSELELQEIFKDPTRSYVYVGKEINNIAYLMVELAKFDDNQESLVHRLKNHIEKGFNIANYDGVAQTLEYAEQLLAKKRSSLDEKQARALTQALDRIIEQVINEDLNLDAEKLYFLKDSVDVVENVRRSGLRLLDTNEKMNVHGKSKFFKEVTFNDDVTIRGSLSVVDGDNTIYINLLNEIKKLAARVAALEARK